MTVTIETPSRPVPPPLGPDEEALFRVARRLHRRLYVADGGHVRVVERNGVIHTVAGSRRGRPSQTIGSGTPALSAPLGPARPLVGRATPLSLAVSSSAQLYISTGTQILRLTSISERDAPTGMWLLTPTRRGRSLHRACSYLGRSRG